MEITIQVLISVDHDNCAISDFFFCSQGFVVDELSQLLVENYGIPKTVIAVKMAKGVKSKKKH